DQGEERERERPAACACGIEKMYRKKSAEAEEHSMSKGQEARLTQKHVVGQCEDGHRRHQAHRRQREPRSEHVWQQQEKGGERYPDCVSPDRTASESDCDVGIVNGLCFGHVSRVPMSPRGRKMRISTRSR